MVSLNLSVNEIVSLYDIINIFPYYYVINRADDSFVCSLIIGFVTAIVASISLFENTDMKGYIFLSCVINKHGVSTF